MIYKFMNRRGRRVSQRILKAYYFVKKIIPHKGNPSLYLTSAYLRVLCGSKKVKV